MFPYLGYGLGFRLHYSNQILNELPKVDWFEIITEDYLVPGGKVLHILDRLIEHYPVVMHGVSLSIGSSDKLDHVYLKKVKQLAEYIKPKWISDHLCWTGLKGTHLHDLLPLPYTTEAIKHVAAKVREAQDILEQHILLENVSSYVTFKDSMLQEWEFLAAIAEQADCYILLDINNIYVSALNHGFNSSDYINNIPIHRVKQFHLAGHDKLDTCIIDTHNAPIVEGVWKLYAEAIRRFGKISTLIERDDNFPPLSELLNELQKAKTIAETILIEKAKK